MVGGMTRQTPLLRALYTLQDALDPWAPHAAHGNGRTTAVSTFLTGLTRAAETDPIAAHALRDFSAVAGAAIPTSEWDVSVPLTTWIARLEADRRPPASGEGRHWCWVCGCLRAVEDISEEQARGETGWFDLVAVRMACGHTLTRQTSVTPYTTDPTGAHRLD